MRLSQRLLAGFFVFAGAMHFVRPKYYEAIMPPYVPRHREVVAVSGAAEIAGGLAVIPEGTRHFGGLWLVALLAAVFPANLHMALNAKRYKKIPAWALYARLPFQALFIWDVWRTAVRGA